MFVSEGVTGPWLKTCKFQMFEFLDRILTTGDGWYITYCTWVLIETSDVAFFADFAVQSTVDCTLPYRLL